MFETAWQHSSLLSFLDSYIKEEKVSLFRKKVFTFYDKWQECHNALCLKIHSYSEIIMYAAPNIKVHLYEDNMHTLMSDLYKTELQFQ
jgi:hypothetical protein